MSASQVIEREASTPAARSRPRVARRTLALAGLALAVGLGAAWYGYEWWTVGRFVESTDDAYAGGNVTPISPHVAGFVAEILVADNQYVARRASADPARRPGFPRRRRPRGGDRRTARRRRSTACGRKQTLQQTTIRQAKAELAAKTAQAAFAKQDDQRYRGPGADHRRITAEAQRASGAGPCGASRRRSRPRPALDARDAATHGAGRGDRRRPRPTSPRPRPISDRPTQSRLHRDSLARSTAMSAIAPPQVGAYVASGAYLVTVIPAHGLWVDANFKEDQLARMTPGQPRRSSPTSCRTTSFAVMS